MVPKGGLGNWLPGLYEFVRPDTPTYSRESIKRGASVDDLWVMRGMERAAESKQHE